MSFIGKLMRQMERSTAGSDDTAIKVLKLCGEITPQKALFLGDDSFTPKHIVKQFPVCAVTATYHEDYRAEKAEAEGLSVKLVGTFEFLKTNGGWDFVWYNGNTEPDGTARRLEQLYNCLKKGGMAVFRTLCWLIDPSLDTKYYVEHRFGRPVPFDSVLREAKEQGFKIHDFYIAPKSDWTGGFYRPMSEIMRTLEGASEEDDAQSGIGEINKEIYMFDLHSEEYSYVYYILRQV